MVNRLTKNPTWRAVALKIALLGGGSVVQVVAATTAPDRPAAGLLRQQIKEILSQPEYQTGPPVWLVRLMRQAIELVARVLRWIFLNPTMERLYSQWPVLYWLVVIAVAAALLLLIYHIVVAIGGAFGRRQAKRKPPQPKEIEAHTSPARLRRLARQLAARGDFAGALRALYESSLRRLEREGYLRWDPWRTNGEYLNAVHDEPQLHRLLDSLTRAVDEVIYGRHRLASAGYQRLAALADELGERAAG